MVEQTELLQTKSIEKETKEQESPKNYNNNHDFLKLFKNLEIIIKAASFKCHVIDENFPSEFYEPDPHKIYESYIAFLKEKQPKEREQQIIKTTNIKERFENKYYYQNINGFYKLYHDIFLVCTILINTYKRGTHIYCLVDKFYKFTTELLLRECYKTGISLTDYAENKNKNDNEKSSSNTDNYTETDFLDDYISRDFIKISTHYTVPVKEVYHLSTKGLELFSSKITKSSLDKRGDYLPNPNFDVVRISPLQPQILRSAAKLGVIAAKTSMVPEPTLPPTEMLSKFVHPNWFNLPCCMWLEYSDNEFKSLAPTIMEMGSILDANKRGVIWFQKNGYFKKWKEREEAINNNTKRTADNHDRSDHDITAVVADTVSNNNNTNTSEDNNNTESENTDNEEEDQQMDVNKSSDAEKEIDYNYDDIKVNDIKLSNLLSWSPIHYITEGELIAMQNGISDVQKLITNTLLELKILQDKRNRLGLQTPATKEQKLYYKLKRLFKFVLLNCNQKTLNMPLIKEFPILQANYSGNIPVVRQHGTQKRFKKHRK